MGCQKKSNVAPPAETPVVPVCRPVERTVTEFVEYTGRADAVDSVGVRARATGYLIKMPFEEGSEIKKGDLLFEIDPRQYEVQVNQAQSQLGVVEAQLKLAKITYERSLKLLEKASISQQEVDQNKAAVDEAAARLEAAKASLGVYKLNLSFTKVTAPVDGRVSRYYYSLGNLVTQDQTLLTTIVSTDPMYVYFDVEERTFQRIVAGINRGRGFTSQDVSSKDAKLSLPVKMGLEGEDDFPRSGTLTFINNQVNPSTGTVAVRAVFRNSRPEGGTWSLIPGMYARVRLPIGEPHKSLLVVDKAIGSDQGLKFVYVIDADNLVQYRRVTTGPIQADGLRVIEDGLKPDDRVVVGALQQLRPKMEVKVEDVAMPTAGGESPTSNRNKPQPPPPGGGKKPGGRT
jgi:multidrug efflux system membrane fusion protein